MQQGAAVHERQGQGRAGDFQVTGDDVEMPITARRVTRAKRVDAFFRQPRGSAPPQTGRTEVRFALRVASFERFSEWPR